MIAKAGVLAAYGVEEIEAWWVNHQGYFAKLEGGAFDFDSYQATYYPDRWHFGRIGSFRTREDAIEFVDACWRSVAESADLAEVMRPPQLMTSEDPTFPPRADTAGLRLEWRLVEPREWKRDFQLFRGNPDMPEIGIDVWWERRLVREVVRECERIGQDGEIWQVRKTRILVLEDWARHDRPSWGWVLIRRCDVPVFFKEVRGV